MKFFLEVTDMSPPSMHVAKSHFYVSAAVFQSLRAVIKPQPWHPGAVLAIIIL